jgi:hypothetical protein
VLLLAPAAVSWYLRAYLRIALLCTGLKRGEGDGRDLGLIAELQVSPGLADGMMTHLEVIDLEGACFYSFRHHVPLDF